MDVILRYNRAKYIEGLENRLGRMESLLKLSGLINEDDLGKTDLGTLVKRLADKLMANAGNSSKGSNRSNSVNPSSVTPEANQGTPDNASWGDQAPTNISDLNDDGRNTFRKGPARCSSDSNRRGSASSADFWSGGRRYSRAGSVIS